MHPVATQCLMFACQHNVYTGYKGTVTFRLFVKPHLIVVFSLQPSTNHSYMMCVHYMGCTLWQNANLQTNNFGTNLVCFLKAFTFFIFRLMFSLHIPIKQHEACPFKDILWTPDVSYAENGTLLFFKLTLQVL